MNAGLSLNVAFHQTPALKSFDFMTERRNVFII
jgi:hypothetical protein